MDYIIFGMGTGASLVLVGWLLRELGPRIRDRAPAEGTVLSGGELVLRMAWSRFCGACGMAMLLCGLLILIVTGVLTVLSAGDDLGTMIVLGAFALAVLLMLLWVILFIRQFGTFGIIRGKRPKAVASPADFGTPDQPDGAPVAAPEPTTPSEPDLPFEQAATSRGGFGRFAGFIRPGEAKQDAPGTPGDEKRLDVNDPLVQDVAIHLRGVDGAAPEDLVIEELGAGPSNPDGAGDAIASLRQKRLARLAEPPAD